VRPFSLSRHDDIDGSINAFGEHSNGNDAFPRPLLFEFLLEDEEYANRIKRHYQLFKEKVGARRHASKHQRPAKRRQAR
jgi:hypothetical protein